MAFESYYWRRDIKRDIRLIRSKMAINIFPIMDERLDEIFSIVEIKLFLMAFSIRKLLEARKLPDSIANKTIKVKKFPRNSTRSSFFNFETMYDFKNPQSENLKLKDILNQFIHAYFFQAFSTRKGNLRYVYVTSDKAKNKFLYVVNIQTFLKFIEKISVQEVTRSETHFDPKSGEFITKTW